MPADDFIPGDRLEQARVLAYQDPLRSMELARLTLAEAEAAGDEAVAARAGWLLALGEMRVGQAEAGEQALQTARRRYGEAGDLRGQRLCDEVRAIGLRRLGHLSACRALLEDIDRRCIPPEDDFDLFLAHNSRAITLKALGLTDLTLTHFYAALDAAERLRWAGPRVVAAANLGGFHLDLHNLDDALTISRRAQQAALSAEMAPIIGTATVNLIAISYALGQRREARALTDFLIANEGRLLPGALQGFAAYVALGYLAGGDLTRAQAWLDQAGHHPNASIDSGELRAWVQARTLLEQGDAAAACRTVEGALASQDPRRGGSPPYDRLELLRAAADAFERHGDLSRAMAYLRRAQQVHEDLLGRSARARYRALQADAEYRQAQRERDEALAREHTAAEDRQRLEQLNQALRAQVEANERLQAALREQAVRDSLTALHNRRHLTEAAPAAIGFARRKRQPLTLALLELDHFKAVHDRHGRAGGDRLLLAVAELLRGACRSSDMVCRWGGEEFVLLMTDTSRDVAAGVLLRLQQALARAHVVLDSGLPLEPASFTAGIVSLVEGDHALDDLMRRADAVLQAAKRSGDARIEAA